MFSISNQAVERLREEIVRKCFQANIGFRILVGSNESGEATFNIKFDRQRQAHFAIIKRKPRGKEQGILL